MMRTSSYLKVLLAIALATTLQMIAPASSSVASGSHLPEEAAIADRQAQQIQLPTIDFDPKKWAEDAISAVLQDLGDGIRSGMDALWAANFITQTPPSLTYQNGDVRSLHATMQRIANAALAVIATVGALNTVVRPYLGFRYPCRVRHPEASDLPAEPRLRRTV